MAEGGSKSAKYRGFSTHPQLAALASHQHVVFSLEQLRALGLSSRAVHDRAAAGRLHRVHQSVYSLVPPELLTRNGRYMAAVLACGAGAVLSHRAAAELHGLGVWERVEVTVPGRGRRRHARMTIHRSVTLAAADVMLVAGIPCTTVARALFDLAEVVPRRRAEKAFDRAEVLELFDLRAIQDQLARNPTRRGVKTVQSILEEHYIGSTLTESELEEAAFVLSRTVGLPLPEVNKWIDLGDGEPMIRADFVWRAQRLILEVDGERYHRTRQAFENDRRRDQRATAAGWRVIRTTHRQIKHRPHELHATIARLLRARKLS